MCRLPSHFVVKGIVPPKLKFCHYLLNLTLFQTWMSRTLFCPIWSLTDSCHYIRFYHLWKIEVCIQQNKSYCIHRKKESHTGLKWHECEEMMTPSSFFLRKKDTYYDYAKLFPKSSNKNAQICLFFHSYTTSQHALVLTVYKWVCGKACQ